MKKIVVCSLAIIFMASCNNSSTTEEPAPAPTNVQNVNGNIPDTTSSSTLNGSTKVDSSQVKDSVRH